MASSTERLYTDMEGKMFVPMNMEGNSSSEGFFTPGKFIVLAAMILTLILMIAGIKNGRIAKQEILVSIGLWVLAFQFLVRFVIFEERYYYKLYKKMQDKEVTDPSPFYNIVSIRESMLGSVMIYRDARIGILVRMERDTIVGKPRDFESIHYDAVSDFYGSILSKGYNFVQMDIMEPAGNDPRLLELDRRPNRKKNSSSGITGLEKMIASGEMEYASYEDMLASQEEQDMEGENKNVREIVKLMNGYIKSKTRVALYNSDYFLIMYKDMSRIDDIISDVASSLGILLNGAYIGYRVLNPVEISAFVTEYFGIKYFDSSEAALENQGVSDANAGKALSISGIVFEDGARVRLSQEDKSKIKFVIDGINRGVLNPDEVSIENVLKAVRENSNVDVGAIQIKGHTKPKRPERKAPESTPQDRKTPANKVQESKKPKKIEPLDDDDDFDIDF